MTPISGRAVRRLVSTCILIFLSAAVLLPWVGPGVISPRSVLHRDNSDAYIFWQLRVTRTLLALFAGGALSLGGTLFQALLRDALATPYTLGVSTGASLGAVITICLGVATIGGIPAVWVGALAGSLAVLVLVMTAAAPQRRITAFGLLLTGVAINSMCSSVILLLHSMAGVSRSFSISRWLIGSIDATSYRSLCIFLITVCIASLLVIVQAKDWNLLSVDEHWAATRGVRVQPLMLIGYILGSVLTAATIALTGPIAFVELIVPHMLRARFSSDHRVLMPCSFLLGGTLVAVCDAIGRVIVAPNEIPAGVTLALIGGPYMVWLVRERVS
ncbi:FecCD family ABC transporter permease [Silvibacterium acidisoli]|uniref:FecCD family ABC transporter permease n=1 Tax=Acidobacteriaceae bacterium ZG23-2 TaxID=2883246 RepID=UPI00406C86AF